MAKHNSKELPSMTPPSGTPENKGDESLLARGVNELRKKKPSQDSENKFLMKMQQADEISKRIEQLDKELFILSKKIEHSEEDTVSLSEFESKKAELDFLYIQLFDVQSEYAAMVEQQSAATDENVDESMQQLLTSIEARKNTEIIPKKIDKIKSKWDEYEESFTEVKPDVFPEEKIEEIAQKTFARQLMYERIRDTKTVTKDTSPKLFKEIKALEAQIPEDEVAEVKRRVQTRVKELRAEHERQIAERELAEQQARIDDALRQILPLLEQRAILQANTPEDTKGKLDNLSKIRKLESEISQIVATLPSKEQGLIQKEITWIRNETVREAKERRKEDDQKAQIAKDFYPTSVEPKNFTPNKEYEYGRLATRFATETPMTTRIRGRRENKAENPETRERATQVRNELIDMKRNVSRFTFGGLWGAFKNKLRFTETQTGMEPSKEDVVLPADQLTDGLSIADPKPENMRKIIEKLSKSSKPHDQADAKMLQEYEDKLDELTRLSLQLE